VRFRPIFVSATGTDVGKTYTALRLIKAFGAHNIRVGVCKPIETGVTGVPQDAQLLLGACRQINPLFASLTPHEITAYTFSLPAAPFCADEDQTIQVDKIIHTVKTLQQRCDLLVIEGAGGLMTPITSEYLMIDLAHEIGAYTLLVTHDKLGCINDTLLSIEALQNRNMPFDWCINIRKEREEFDMLSKPFYDARFPHWWEADQGMDSFAHGFLKEQL